MSDRATQAAVRELDASDDLAPGIVKRLLVTTEAWTFLVLVALVLFFALYAPGHFLTTFNITSIVTDASTLLVLGVGLTFVIITAGIDLSVGSVLVLSGVVAGEVMLHGGGANAGASWMALGIACGLATGLVWGVLQGIVVAKAKVPPLIVTLGGLGAALGIAQIITGGEDIREVPDWLSNVIGNGTLFGHIPWMVVIAVVIIVIFGLVLYATRFGRYTYAIGSNPESARRAGINVDRHLIKVYALCGLMAGVAGVMSLGWFTTTTISGHTTDNLDAITAVVLGGTSLFGGKGSVIGMVIGVLIPAVLKSGVVIIGMQSYWQSVAVGVVLVGAVFVDQMRRRGRDRG